MGSLSRASHATPAALFRHVGGSLLLCFLFASQKYICPPYVFIHAHFGRLSACMMLTEREDKRGQLRNSENAAWFITFALYMSALSLFLSLTSSPPLLPYTIYQSSSSSCFFFLLIPATTTTTTSAFATIRKSKEKILLTLRSDEHDPEIDHLRHHAAWGGHRGLPVVLDRAIVFPHGVCVQRGEREGKVDGDGAAYRNSDVSSSREVAPVSEDAAS
ncbi:hypothetical protein B0F90DRAFT_830647 [Multifurca ochricompacta]|uniref:Uncharacterized protein n=1 Tax=Multifurca ochricompacta TaxID=376703 RepID=A0AAD4M3D5_9AGAM|nr:hypothetical protein B0F90DRAFT_830647 [Multifurca ochricompacta]